METTQEHVQRGDAKYVECFLAGSIAGTLTMFIATPVDLIKVKLQKQPGFGREYKGPSDVVKTIVKDSGARALYRGFIPMAFRYNTPLYFKILSNVS